MAQWVGQQGSSEALGMDSNPSLYLHFSTLKTRRKFVIAPPLLCLLCMKIFDTRIFLKPARVLLRNFLVLWEKKIFDGKIVIPPTPLIHKNFRYQKVSETQKGSSTKCFGTVRQKIFDKKSLYPPSSYPWKFSIPEILGDTEGFFYEIFRYCETKNYSTKNRDTPSYA